MKKIFNGCNNPAENSDIYSEGRESDMFSYDELMKKSVRELRFLLADDTLFPLDDNKNAEIIERICDVIIKKEGVKSIFRKSRTQKSWKRFEQKYISPDSENEVVEKEVAVSRKTPVFVKVLTVVSAAAIIVFAVNMNLQQTPKLEEDITPMHSFEITPEPEFIDSLYAMNVEIAGLPAAYKATAHGMIPYADGSKKSYSIFSSDDEMFFVSLLTKSSEGGDTPAENEKDIFDIFADAGIDDTNIKNGGETLRTSDAENLKVVIYGDIPREFSFGVGFSNVDVDDLNMTGNITGIFKVTEYTKNEKEP